MSYKKSISFYRDCEAIACRTKTSKIDKINATIDYWFEKNNNKLIILINLFLMIVCLFIFINIT